MRDDDGVLGWHGGPHYSDPGEAIKTWWVGELRLGCAESVFGNYSSSPCGCIPKHDPDVNGRFTRCGKHSTAAKAKRKAAQEKRDQAWRRKMDLQNELHKATIAVEPALRQIADGHNDPRTLAQEVLSALDAIRAALK